MLFAVVLCVHSLGSSLRGRAPRFGLQAAFAVSCAACKPTPVGETPTHLATASSTAASAAPVAAFPSEPRTEASPVDVGQVPTARIRGEGCEVDVLPASQGTAVGGWLDAFRLMNADGFSAHAPRNDAEAKAVLSGVNDCEEVNCDGPLLPVALSIGEDPTPAGYRLGIVETSQRGMFLHGPWEAGVQIYHCIPHLRAEVHAAASDGGVQHVGVQSVQPDVVAVSADGECKWGAPDCNIGCFPQHVWRFDLYVSATGQGPLLIVQERSLPDDSDAQSRLLESLPPTFRHNDVKLSPCSDGEARQR